MFSLAVLVYGIMIITLESTLLVKLPVWFGRPDLLFILMVWLATRFNDIREIILVIVLGLILNVTSGVNTGIYPVAYLLTFLLIRGAIHNFNLDSNNHQAALITFAYVVFFLTVWLFSAFTPYPALIPWSHAIPELVALAILSFPMMHFFDRTLAPFNDKEITRRIFQRHRSKNRYL